ncbi:MAG: hypothetical protein K2H60_05230 [Muribaculaceae bacterium]|nr:hypothetical protein [Muribaculaceae bacterium]
MRWGQDWFLAVQNRLGGVHNGGEEEHSETNFHLATNLLHIGEAGFGEEADEGIGLVGWGGEERRGAADEGIGLVGWGGEER